MAASGPAGSPEGCGWQVSEPCPLPVVWWGLPQSSVPGGAVLGTDRAPMGTLTWACHYTLVLHKALGTGRALQPCRDRLLPGIIWAFSKLFSLHILDTMNMYTQDFAIALGFQSRWFIQSLSQSAQSFSSWPQTSQSQLLFFTIRTTWFLLEEQQTHISY